jgi:hypothetical protein
VIIININRTFFDCYSDSCKSAKLALYVNIGNNGFIEGYEASPKKYKNRMLLVKQNTVIIKDYDRIELNQSTYYGGIVGYHPKNDSKESLIPIGRTMIGVSGGCSEYGCEKRYLLTFTVDRYYHRAWYEKDMMDLAKKWGIPEKDLLILDGSKSTKFINVDKPWKYIEGCNRTTDCSGRDIPQVIAFYDK